MLSRLKRCINASFMVSDLSKMRSSCKTVILFRACLWQSRTISTAANDTNSKNQIDKKTKTEKEGSTREKGVNIYIKKLHNRTFSEEELWENKEFVKSKQAFPESDTFGLLQQDSSQKQKLSPVHSKEPSSRSSSDTAQIPDFLSYAKNQQDFYNNFKNKTVRKTQQRSDWGDEFGTLQQEDALLQRAEESLMSEVGSHEERLSDDEDDSQDKQIPLSKYNRRHLPEWYGRKILKLGKKGEVREALEVFEQWMLKKDRVMPNAFVYTCLLTTLGRAGYTQKAFSLYNKMKKMGIEPKPATYTALFNACANSPWKHDGQKRASSLYQLMKDKEIQPTFITGKAMIKAFAMCGDLRQAFRVTDELCAKFRPDPELFSFLLMACISDREAGLRHAIQVWQLMLQLGVRPDLPLYNLLLRCVRDCNVGDVAEFQSLLTSAPSRVPPLSPGAIGVKKLGVERESLREQGGIHRLEDRKLVKSVIAAQQMSLNDVEKVSDNMTEDAMKGKESRDSISSLRKDQSEEGENIEPEDLEKFSDIDKMMTITDRIDLGWGNPHVQKHRSEPKKEILRVPKTGKAQSHNMDKIHSSLLADPKSHLTIPDVLSSTFDPSCLVAFGDLSTRESRLALLGGVDGVLGRMAKDHADANIVTFCQLMSVAPPSCQAEELLLERMGSLKVKPDIDLVNTLIHKRCMRQDYAAAKAATKIIMDHSLKPNQRSFGVLAMACRSQPEAEQLLAEMESYNMAANIEILGTMMRAAGMKFGYRLWVLWQVQRGDLKPNVKFLQNCEAGLAVAKRNIVEAEKREDRENFFLTPQFQESLERFEHHYEAWLTKVKVERPPHPWAPFEAAVAADSKIVSTTPVVADSKIASVAPK